MHLYYFKHSRGLKNFGDDLNPWLFNLLLPSILDDNREEILVGIGTLLNAQLLPESRKTIVFSSGAGYGTVPKVNNSWKIYCLRGPLTARKLRVSQKLAISDGAMLVKEFYKSGRSNDYKFSYMPHVLQACSSEKSLKKICHAHGIHYIDPRKNVEDVLHSITKTEQLITEALHGAIVAHSFGVPWIPVRTTGQVLQFKWEDWCASMKISYAPIDILPIWDLPRNPTSFQNIRHGIKERVISRQLKNVFKKHLPVTSNANKVNETIERLMEKSRELISDINRNSV